MRTILTIASLLFACAGLIETILAIKANSFEDEVRWRLHALASLGFMILFAVIRD
jgi:hypothetical protein